MVTSRSSVGTSYSDRAIPEESIAGNVSAEGANRHPAASRSAALMDGGDFLSLFRAASALGLKSIEEDLDGDDAITSPADFADGGDVTTPGQDSIRSQTRASVQTADTGTSNTPSIRTPQVYPKRSSQPATPGRSIRSLDLDRSPAPPSRQRIRSMPASSSVHRWLKRAETKTTKPGGLAVTSTHCRSACRVPSVRHWDGKASCISVTVLAVELRLQATMSL